MTKEYQKNIACKSLSLIMLEFVIRTLKKILPQTLLEKKKMGNLINDLDLSSSDESDDGSDNESDNDESND